jgi:hypothetical protein
MITQEQLKQLVEYDPETGNFRWLIRPRQRACSDFAGTVNPYGYRHICLKQKIYRAHRLAWFYYYGEWPNGQIDHINGNRDDNRIVNLRLATYQQNQANSKIRVNNRTGFKGVHFHKLSKLYMARVMVAGKSHLLGYYKTPEEAHAAYIVGSKHHFGEFARAM